jgi:hypothetical protein
MDDSTTVLAANQAFYNAHEARDLEAMTQVWEHSSRVACIHPGWPILRGWDNVMLSWEGIFRGSGRNQFILTNESHVVIGPRTVWRLATDCSPRFSCDESVSPAQPVAGVSMVAPPFAVF